MTTVDPGSLFWSLSGHFRFLPSGCRMLRMFSVSLFRSPGGRYHAKTTIPLDTSHALLWCPCLRFQSRASLRLLCGYHDVDHGASHSLFLGSKRSLWSPGGCPSDPSALHSGGCRNPGYFYPVAGDRKPHRVNDYTDYRPSMDSRIFSMVDPRFPRFWRGTSEGVLPLPVYPRLIPNLRLPIQPSTRRKILPQISCERV